MKKVIMPPNTYALINPLHQNVKKKKKDHLQLENVCVGMCEFITHMILVFPLCTNSVFDLSNKITKHSKHYCGKRSNCRENSQIYEALSRFPLEAERFYAPNY